MRRLAAGALALLVAGAAFAQSDHAGHAAPAAKRAARPELGASAAVGPDGRLWAVYKDGGHVMLRGSADAGRNWSEPRRVNAQAEPIQADGEGRPKVAIGPQGEIHVTWTRPLAKPYTGEIRYARSSDGGAAFSPVRTVHGDRQEITHRFDALTVTREGRLVIAWIDKRDLEAAKARGADYRGAAVYYAVSDDRGESFRPEAKLADHSCECCRIALVPEDDGGVTAMWRQVFAPNVRDHALARIEADGGAGTLRRATFDDWRIDACPHHGPSAARDAAGRLHAVWFTQGERRSGVYYGRPGEGQLAGLRRVGGERAEHADLAVAGERVAIAWKEFDGEKARLRALRSDDGGNSWQAHELAATAEASDQPRLVVREGRFLVLWNTRERPLWVIDVPDRAAR